ncbi:hypothetical protein COCVIDRAFT_31852 [Bipolaris victoriae FI3]|uniref:Chromo domain-containing protein n=1 Tax=Bipolaris victoriae (strain FI3) TaxID=930091 RepID=W7DRE8_BIPV3|nr:hypothetical protein COCVIDRAFT_31852 [Bipolaris victoriae FI3]
MVSKQTANKRKRTSNTLARNKRRRTTRLAYTNASEPYRGHGPASEKFWAARRILKDNGTRYLVEWEGIDPATGRLYEPTWEPHDFVTPALEAEWKEIIAARSTVTGHTHGQAQSFGEADSQIQSLGGSPGLVTVGQPPTKRLPQCQSASTAFPQQKHQSRRSSSSLFLKSQQSTCVLEDRNSHTCGIIPARQDNVTLTINTTTTLKETSGSNQWNPAIVNGAGDMDENLGTTDPAALGLRHSVHAQSPACIKKINSVGFMQLSSHPDPVGKLQGTACKESEIPESPSQDRLEILELARQEPQKAYACTLEEKGLSPSALLAAKKPLEAQEPREMHSEPEILASAPIAPTNEAIYGEPEFRTEAEAVFYTETGRGPVVKKAVSVLLPGETVEKQSKALVSSEQSLRRLSQECGTYEKGVMRHALAEPDKSDGPTRLLALSEQSTLPSLKHGGSILQHLKMRACTSPVLAKDRRSIAPSASSSQLGSRLDPKTTAGRTFTRPDVNIPARDRSAKTCSLPSEALAECARYTSEQTSPSETETGGLPTLPALNRSVRSSSPTDQKRSQNMELAQQHMQSPVGCRRYSQRWTTRSHEPPQGDIPLLQCRDACPMGPQSRSRGYDLAYILNGEPSLNCSQRIHQGPHNLIQSADTVSSAVTGEERKYQSPASSGETGSHDLSHALYPREQLSPPAHRPPSPLAPVPVHERDASNQDSQVTHPIQTLPLSCHNLRVYNQISQSMDHVTVDPSAVASEAHQQRAQSSRFPLLAIPTAALLIPSLSWHKPAASSLKTEKQKMLDGEPFMPYSSQLFEDRRQCAAVLNRLNNTIDAVPEAAQRMHERYFRAVIEAAWTQPRCRDSPAGGRLGSNTYVATPFHCDYGYNVSVGDNVIIGPKSKLLDSAKITIGRNTRIGACVTITTLKTPTDMKALKRSYGLEVAKDIYIGENVYIGDCCVIGAGVRVGNGAIVRSGSVVVHDIPPDYIAYGNPANMCKAN